MFLLWFLQPNITMQDVVIRLLVSLFIVRYITIGNIVIKIIIKLMISFILVTSIFILFIKNTVEYKELLNLIKGLVSKIFGKTKSKRV